MTYRVYNEQSLHPAVRAILQSIFSLEFLECIYAKQNRPSRYKYIGNKVIAARLLNTVVF